MSDKHLYKVTFFNQEQVYEIYVKHVYQGDLYGFVIIEDFVFGEKIRVKILTLPRQFNKTKIRLEKYIV